MLLLPSSFLILSWPLETDGRAAAEGAAATPNLLRVLGQVKSHVKKSGSLVRECIHHK